LAGQNVSEVNYFYDKQDKKTLI